MASGISMGARREVSAAVAKRYRTAGRAEKGRILDELTATTGWHRKHAVRALSAVGRNRPGLPLSEEATGGAEPASRRRRKYARVRDALIALWEASDRVCGKRLVSMIPALFARTRAAWPAEADERRACASGNGERGDDRSDVDRR